MDRITYRQAYRTIGKLGMMPARNMELIMMFQWTCETLDFSRLNSKFISKLLYLLSQPDFQEMGHGLTVEGYNRYMAIENPWAWRKVATKQMATRAIQMQLNYDDYDQYKDGSAEGRARMVRLLLSRLVEVGGFVRLTELERIHRPDAVGSIEKIARDGERYFCYPCEPVPIQKCGFCNMLNIYSHSDCGLELNEWNTEWRCAACWGDLRYTTAEIERLNMEVDLLANIDTTFGIHGGEQLEKLALLNYGDAYPDLDLEARESLVKKDLSLLRKWFNNAYQCVIEIGTNLSQDEYQNLCSQFPRVIFSTKAKSTNAGHLASYEILAMIADCMPRTRDHFKTNLYGSLQRLYPTQDINYLSQVQFGTVEVSDSKTATIICATDHELTMKSFSKMLSEETILIIPKLASQMNHLSTQLEYNGRIYYQLGYSGIVCSLPKDLHEKITDSQLLQIRGQIVMVTVIQECANWRAYKLTKLRSMPKTHDWAVMEYQRMLNLSVPLPDMDNAISNPMFSLFKIKQIKFDFSLFNMLTIRNITGKLSYDSLRTFAVGYAKRTFSVGGHKFKNMHIVYDMLETHVFLALVISRAMMASTSVNQNVIEWHKYPIIKSHGPQLVNAVLQTVTEIVKTSLSKLIGVDVISLIMRMTTKMQGFVDNWLRDTEFFEVLAKSPVNTVKNLRVSRVDCWTKKREDYCGHHMYCQCTPASQDACKCCKIMEPIKAGFCTCCAPKTLTDLMTAYDLITVERDNVNSDKYKQWRKPNKVSGKNKPVNNFDAEKPLSDDQVNNLIGKDKSTKVEDINQLKRVGLLNDMRTKVEEDLGVTISDEIDELNTARQDVELMLYINDPEASFANNAEIDDEPFKSIIKFNIHNCMTSKPDWYKVIDVKDAQNKSVNSCAAEALSNALGMDVEISMLTNTPGEMVQVENLLNFAMDHGINLLVVAENTSCIVTPNKFSNSYYTVLHGSAVSGKPRDHYMAGKILQVSGFTNYLSNVNEATTDDVNACMAVIDSNLTMQTVKKRENVIVNAMVRGLYEVIKEDYKRMQPKIFKNEGECLLSNNSKTSEDNIYAGKIHTEVRKELADVLELISSPSENSHESNLFPQSYDRLEFDSSKAMIELNNLITAEIQQWLTIKNKLLSKSGQTGYVIKSYHNVDLIEEGSNLYMPMTLDKLKTMDMVVLKQNQIVTRALIKVNKLKNRTYFVPEFKLTMGNAKLMTLKMSYSSFLRKIIACCSTEVEEKECVRLLSEAKLITGPAGSGKTSMLVKIATKNDLIVCMTGDGRAALQQKLKDANKGDVVPNVMTLERACIVKPLVQGNLIVDEASQIAVTSIMPLLSKTVKSIHLFGESNQIGVPDMLTGVVGERIMYTLADIIKVKPKPLEKSWRIGFPLAKELQRIIPTFVGNESKRTEIKFEHLRGPENELKEEFAKLVKHYNPKVITNPIVYNVNWIKAILEDKDMPNLVKTSFSFQGSEAEVVMYVVKKNQQGQWGTCRNLNHLTSALTRASQLMVVVIIGSVNNEENVADLPEIGLMGGGTAYSKASFEAPLSVQRRVAAAGVAKFPGANVVITEGEGGSVKYSITGPFNLGNVVMTYKKGVLNIDTKSEIARNIIMSSINDTKLSVQHNYLDIKHIRFDRLRTLTWACDKYIGVDLGIEFYHNGTWYRLTKSKGCPFNSGLKLVETRPKLSMVVTGVKERVLLKISSEVIGSRKLEVYDQTDEVANDLAAWLELGGPGVKLKYNDNADHLHHAQLENEFFGLKVPDGINSAMLLDRVLQLPTCLASWATNNCQYDRSCTGNVRMHQQSLSGVIDRARKDGTNIKLPEYVVNHKNVVYKVHKNGLYGSTMNMYVYQGKNLASSTKNIVYMKDVILHMNLVNEDIKLINNWGAIHGKLDGLTIDMVTHKEHNTSVYKEYVKRMSKIKDYTTDSLDNSLWITQGRIEPTKTLLNEYTCKLSTNSHNYRVDDVLCEILDGIMLLQDGRISKGTIIAYCGLELVLPSLYSMHYIKLWCCHNSTTSTLAGITKYREAIGQISAFVKGVASDRTDLDEQAMVMNQVCVDYPSECKVVLAGTALMYSTLGWVEDTLDKGASCVYGWLPSNDIHPNLATLISHNGHIFINSIGNNVQHKVEESIMSMLKGARKFKQGRELVVQVKDSCLGFNYVQCKYNKVSDVLVLHRPIATGNVLNVSMPWIKTDIKSILNSNTIFTIKTLKVLPNLFRSFTMRLLTEKDVTMTDLLSYARTVASAYETSETNFRLKYHTDVVALRDTAYAAWYYHKKYTQQFEILLNLWGQLGSMGDLAMINVTTILKEILNITQLVTDVADYAVDKLNDIIKLQTMKLGFVKTLLAKTSNSLQAVIDYEHSTLIIRPSQGGAEDHFGEIDEADDDPDELGNDDDQSDEGNNKPSSGYHVNNVGDESSGDVSSSNTSVAGDDSNDEESEQAGERIYDPNDEAWDDSHKNCTGNLKKYLDGLLNETNRMPSSAEEHLKLFGTNIKQITDALDMNVESDEFEKMLVLRLDDLGLTVDDDRQLIREVVTADMHAHGIAMLYMGAKYYKDVKQMLQTDMSLIKNKQILWSGFELNVGTIIKIWLLDIVIICSMNRDAESEEEKNKELLKKERTKLEEEQTELYYETIMVNFDHITSEFYPKLKLNQDKDKLIELIREQAAKNNLSFKDFVLVKFRQILLFEPKMDKLLIDTTGLGLLDLINGDMKKLIYNYKMDAKELLWNSGMIKNWMNDVVMFKLCFMIGKNWSEEFSTKTHKAIDFNDAKLNYDSGEPVDDDSGKGKEIKPGGRTYAGVASDANNQPTDPVNESANKSEYFGFGSGKLVKPLKPVVDWMDPEGKDLLELAQLSEENGVPTSRMPSADNLMDELAKERYVNLLNRFITVHERVKQSNNALGKMWSNLYKPTSSNQLPCNCQRNHTMIICLGSIGEIVPLMHVADALSKNPLTHVLFISTMDKHIKQIPKIKYYKINTNIPVMQRMAMRSHDNFSVMEFDHTVYAQCVMLLDNIPLKQRRVKLVISNVINPIASATATHFGATLKLTTAAIEAEVTSGMNMLEKAYHNYISTSTLVTDRIKFISSAAWLKITGEQLLNYKLLPGEDKTFKVWCSANKNLIGNAELTYRFEHDFFLNLNNIQTIVTSDKKNVPRGTGIAIVIGSTMNDNWEVLIKQIKNFKEKNSMICLTSNNWSDDVKKLGADESGNLNDCWKFVQFINYNTLFNAKLVITHGGAGIVSALIEQPVRLIVVPMIGDNFLNAKLLSLNFNSCLVTRDDLININTIVDRHLKTKPHQPVKRKSHKHEEAIAMIQNWVKDVDPMSVKCSCLKKHALVHFVGTQGDFNSIVPASIKLLYGYHVVCVTHYDLAEQLPSSWLTVNMATNSKEVAEVAAEFMKLDNFRIIDGLKNYRTMQTASLEQLRKLKDKFDVVITNFFSPFSTTIGNYFKAKIILVDAIPNRLFYVNGKEIVTNLPLPMSESGNDLRFAVLETLDQEAMGVTPTPLAEASEIVTCSSAMYSEFIRNPPDNLFINPDSNTMKQSKNDCDLLKRRLTSMGNTRRILITFGSIPCPDRVKQIIDSLGKDLMMQTIFSGMGNYEHMKNLTNYIPKLNYPDDLKEFDIIVHHGGVGTTYNCIRAKKCQLIWPIFGDQYIWANVVLHKGLGYHVSDIKSLIGVLNDEDVMAMTVTSNIQHNCDLMLKHNTGWNESDLRLKLGLIEHKQEQGLQLTCYGTTDEEPMPLTVGTYFLNATVDYEVMYDPEGYDYCTIKSIRQVADVVQDDLQEIFNWKNPSLQTLKAQLSLLKLNYGINYMGTWEQIVINVENRAIMWLAVEMINGTMHCKAVQPMTPVQQYLIKIEAQDLDPGVLSALRLSLENTSAHSEDLTKTLDILEGMSQSCYEDIKNRKLSLVNRIMRQANKLCFLELNNVKIKGRKVYWATEGDLTNSAIYLTFNTKDNSPTLLTNISCSTGCALIPETGRQDTLLKTVTLMRLKSSVFNKNEAVEQPLQSSISRTYFITVNARNKCKERKMLGCQVYGNQTNAVVWFNCTDNQKHDFYDHRQVAETCSEIILPTSITRADFDKWFLSDNPTILDDGIYTILTDIGNPITKFMKSTFVTLMGHNGYKLVDSKLYLRIDLLTEPGIVKQLKPSTRPNRFKLSDVLNDIDKWDLEKPELLNAMEMAGLKPDDEMSVCDEFVAKKTAIAAATNKSVICPEPWVIIMTMPLQAYRFVIKGGANDNQYSWKEEGSKETERKKDDWWGLKKQLTAATSRKFGLERLDNVSALEFHQVEQISPVTVFKGTGSSKMPQLIESERLIFDLRDVEVVQEDPDYNAMVFWSDGDVLDWLDIKFPKEGRVMSNEWAQRVQEQKKYTLTKYPKYARPVHVKPAFQEHKSIASRLHTVFTVRKTKPPIEKVIKDIFKAYFHEDADKLIKNFMDNKLTYDPFETMIWIEQHHSPAKVFKEVKELFAGELFTTPISTINVHQKVEALLKEVDKVIYRWEHQEARIIAWQRYAVAAIFSPVFKLAKKRLQLLFKNTVIYADGKTPAEISAFLRTTRKVKYIFSNDLSKQDRQTDEHVLAVEFKIYALLGVHEDVLSAWSEVHKDWKYKGKFTKGWRTAMRTTGQATTAIGNVITNMQAHAKFVCENAHNIEFIMVLGDDNSMGFREMPNTKKLRKFIADNFNMMSKDSVDNVGVFCQFLVYPGTSGYNEMSPDYVRLKNRFEVLNGVGEASVENIAMRAMSYAMTIGDTVEIKDLVIKENWPIKPEKWYNQSDAITAMMEKNDMCEAEIINHYKLLLEMMTKREIHEQTIKVFTSQPQRM